MMVSIGGMGWYSQGILRFVQKCRGSASEKCKFWLCYPAQEATTSRVEQMPSTTEPPNPAFAVNFSIN